MKTIKKVHSYLKNLATLKYIFLVTSLNYLFTLIILLLIEYFNLKSNSDFDHVYSSLISQIISSVVLAPLIETCLFQVLPIKFINKIKAFKNKPYIAIMFSALIFGLIHSPYGWINVITAFFTGLVLAYTYVLYKYKSLNAFWCVTVIHSLSNMISVIILYFNGIY